jgi:hypothetical protein
MMGMGGGLWAQVGSGSVAAASFPEMITNGGFAADTDWTKGSGCTISGGVLNCVAGAQLVGQAITYVSGASYRCTFDYTQTNVQFLRINLSSTNGANVKGTSADLSGSGSGSLQFDFVSDVTSGFLFIEADGDVFSGTIDNVSLKRTA